MHEDVTIQLGRPPTRFGRGLVVAAVALLLIAGWAVNWRAKAKDHEMRAELLQQAAAVARTLDPERVKRLSFTEADKANPVFLQLRAQMEGYQPLAHCRGIYTLAARNEELLFGPESYAETDAQASPPGTIYEQPTPQAIEIFKTGRAFTEGPYTDEYGTFVSAFAPVFDPRSGEVLIVVGLDIEAVDWQATMTRERLASGLWALVLAAIGLGEALVLRWRDRMPADRRGRLQYAEVYLIAACGATLTCFVAVALHTEETRARRNLFRQLAETRVERVNGFFWNLRDDEVGALARFYDGSQQVEQDEFRTFAGGILHNGGIQALAWIPSIPAAQKEALEAQAGADGFGGFTVWQNAAGGQREPAAGREAYYPVWYVEPLVGNEAALGYDLGSEPARRKALEEALKSGLTTATDPVTLVLEKRDQTGILIFHPVFSREGKAETLRGFALAVVRLESLLKTALRSWEADDEASSVLDLLQLTSGQDPRFLSSSSRSGAQRHAVGMSSEDVINPEHASVSGVYPLFVFGRSYALVVHPGPAFLADWPTRSGWISASVGLLLTALLMALVAFLTRRSADLETQVLKRTAQLQDSEKRVRLQGSALACAANAVVITDLSGTICWVNPAFSRLTGYSHDEAVGNNPRVLKSGQHDDAFYARIWQTLAAGEVWCGEMINRRKDGTLYHEEMTITPVRDDRGALTHFVAIKQDISERVRAVRLAHERDQLRKAVEAHEQVLGVVGHELRTPLAGLMIISEFLLREDTRNTSEFETFLHNIHDEVERMSGLVNDLLEVARMNSGIARWHWGPVNIQKACMDAAASVRPLIDPQHVHLSVHVASPDLAMQGDEAAVRRLVLNLLSNAAKHTAEGAITVEVRATRLNAYPGVEITITDTGSGMSAETAARLGEAFALNRGVIGDPYVSGSGLGMAICRGIVSAHGGSMTVKSRLSEGTTCVVRLRADLDAPCAFDQPVKIDVEVR